MLVLKALDICLHYTAFYLTNRLFILMLAGSFNFVNFFIRLFIIVIYNLCNNILCIFTLFTAFS